jgi:hypothetical protein
MKNIPGNLACFKISQEGPEPQLDLSYFIIKKSSKIKQYIKNIKNIKETLITIKKLQEEREDKKIVEKYFKKLFEEFNEYSNCSELGCFVNACDTTRDLIREDFDSFKKITHLFIKHRIINEKAPENWVQAIIDNNASRKKGKLGENKLIKILESMGYKLVKDWEEFASCDRCFANFSKDVFSFDAVKERIGISMKTKNQGKMLDLLIKDKNKIFVLEAKHLNTGGGEQNKQIDELIKILELKESRKNIFFISFLDGTYSNKLLSSNISKRSKKLLKQRKQIEKYLKKENSVNYWVNTKGFNFLFKSLRG